MESDDSEGKGSAQTAAKAGKTWPDWCQKLGEFQHPSGLKATWQLLNTLVPYLGLWYLMVRSVQLGYSYFVTLALAVPAAGFVVRLFILFHDCVHSSFVDSKRGNSIIGHVLGVFVFTSFDDWRFTHIRHHGTYANLDSRGFGDIWTMTLKEYESSSPMKRLRYRVYRNPLILVGFGAVFNFLLHNRIPDFRVKRKEVMSVMLTNLLILGVALTVAYFIGWRTYLLIQLPVLWMAGCAGIWLFYVQHQFEGGYWAHQSKWEPMRAAMEGSSFYKLPALFRWFSGRIGYHHIHHLNAMIPNYELKECYDAVPELRKIHPITLMRSLTCAHLKLWDEDHQKMVGFP